MGTSISVQGQNNRNYLDFNENTCSKESAMYYREVKAGDNGNKNVTIHYLNGAVYMTGTCIKYDSVNTTNTLYTGEVKWYHKNGNLKLTKKFNEQGLQVDEEITYYPNGKIWKKRRYVNGIADQKLIEEDESGVVSTIFIEDFNDNENGWELYKSNKNEATIRDGKMFINSFTQQGSSRFINYPIKSKSFTIDVTFMALMRTRPLNYGIIYNFKDWENYAYFQIEGNYFTIGSVHEGINFNEATRIYSDDINIAGGGTNRLKLIGNEEKFACSINGNLVYTFKAKPLMNSNIGFAVGGVGGTYIDQLIVKEINTTEDNGTSEDRNFSKSGTGFMISNSGYLVTNHHVIEDGKKIVIELNGEKAGTYKAEIVASDKETDLAILKITDVNFKNFDKLNYSINETPIEVGNGVFTLGYPMALGGMGKEIKFTDGKISSKTGYQNNLRLMQISVPVQGGNSGSPLFTEKGALVGCINAKFTDADNVAYAIKLNYLKALLESAELNFSLPNDKSIEALPLEAKIKVLSNYIGIIKVKE